MASFDDYDEFGNYIGADLDSDEDEEVGRNQFAPQVSQQRPEVAPLEGFDEDEPMQDDQALMEIDGKPCFKLYPVLQNSVVYSNQSQSTML